MQSDDSTTQIWLWHQRLGHPSFTLLQKKFPLFQHNNVSKFQCETCELAKHHRVSFPLSSNKSSAPFSLIHIGVQGPSRVVSLNGCHWFISFIDDFSQTTWVYLLKEKSDEFTVFQMFHKMVQTQFNTSIKTSLDNGVEYMSGTVQKYFHAYGIIHKPLVLKPLNKMGLLKEKIGISQKSHGPFSLLPMFQRPTGEMPSSLQLISSIERHLATLTSRGHLRYFFHLYHPLILSSLLVSLGVSALSIFMVNLGVNQTLMPSNVSLQVTLLLKRDVNVVQTQGTSLQLYTCMGGRAKRRRLNLWPYG